MIILTRLRSFLNPITSSIAFYPTLYAITAVFLGLLMKVAESNGISTFLQKNAATMVVNDVDTARNILTTLIAGGISMLVFSFSMVMLLLSQAASNYSPRVLPSLISNRKHQTILGIFLGSILYNVFTIIGIDPTGKEAYQLPGFSLLLGIASSIIALAAFVYFIHSISTSIQINNILRDIFNVSHERLSHLIENTDENDEFPDTADWHVYHTVKSGTIQNISISGLLDFVKKNETRIDVRIIKGTYIYLNAPCVKSEKELDEDQVTELFKNFNYSESELVSDNYILGFKQIAEIAVKAMSPGINDPGTALDAINYIAELLALRMKKNDTHVVKNDDDENVINLRATDFKVLIYNIMAPFRTYCKHDMTVTQQLFAMLIHLKKQKAKDNNYYEIIQREASLLLEDGMESITNQVDREVLNNLYKRMTV